MKAKFRVGQTVYVNRYNYNDNYDSFRDKPLVIEHIAKSVSEHFGYDNSVREPLYSFKDIEYSLYEYELELR